MRIRPRAALALLAVTLATATLGACTKDTTAPDTQAPTVGLTGMPGGAVSGTVTLHADATDDHGVAGVRFYLDGQPLGDEDTAAPFEATWNTATATNGTHTLTAIARDAAGNTATSVAVTVTVQNAAAPGTGSIAVTVHTTGTQPDPDGYTVSVDGGARTLPVGIEATVSVPDVAPGTHAVTLTGLAANCRVTGTDPVTVGVVANAAAPASFDVACGGQELALTILEGASQAAVYKVDLDGGHLTALTDPNLNSYGAVWSPDGTKLTFSAPVQGNPQVFVVGADGTGLAELSNREYEWDHAPRWSPDGTQIVFQSNRDQSHEVYVMKTDGTEQARVSPIANPNVDDEDPSFSPDGKTIVFISNRCVWTMKPDGTGLTQLTTPPSESICVETTPVYSPDGAKIAYVSNRDGNQEIYVMNADGTGQTRLTNNTTSDASPTWSPDGTKIAFVEDGNVVIMKLDGSERSVVDLAKDVMTVDWRKPQRVIIVN